MEGEKVVKSRKSMAKALEGLRKVESETKERNAGRKMKKMEVVKEVMSESDSEGFPKWKPKTRDYTGDIVEHKGNIYEAIDESVNDEPPSSNWKLVKSEKKIKGAKRRKNYVPKHIPPPPKPVKEKPKRGRPSKKIAEKMEMFEPKEAPEAKKKRFEKGSAEAKAYMASLRAKKSK